MADAWYVAINGHQQGPFTASQLKQMASGGTLGPEDLLWKEGMPKWVRAGTAKALFAGGPAGTPSAPSRPGPPRAVGVPPRAPARSPRAAAPPPRYSTPSSAFGGESLPAVPVGFPIGPPPAVVPTGPVDGGSDSGYSMQLADFMPRVGARLLDGLFLMLMCIPVIVLGTVLTVTATATELPVLAILVQGAMQFIMLPVVGAYFILLDSSEKQGTWGKQIVGIKVTDLEGRRISRGRAAGRFFANYFLSNCTCGIAFLMPLFTEKKQTLHDMISGCLAMKK
jgi:uncharacterized RDD family membrane protein YckC